jgi:hypothetical protein
VRYVVLVLAALGSACATVAPYERELLADPSMVFGDAPSDDHLDHAITYREGAGGARGVSGGGCGCN